MKKLILLLISFMLFSVCSKASEPSLALNSQDTISNSHDSSFVKKQRLEKLYPWHNSLYLAAGYGTPQGLRIELGYNIFTLFSLGISIGLLDNWSNYPSAGSFAFFGILHLPFFKTQYTPYLLFCFGSSMKIVGGEDDYILTYIGCSVPLLPWVQCRPELGGAFLSKHISGGQGPIDYTTEVRDYFTRFGANLSFEMDIRKLF